MIAYQKFWFRTFLFEPFKRRRLKFWRFKWTHVCTHFWLMELKRSNFPVKTFRSKVCQVGLQRYCVSVLSEFPYSRFVLVLEIGWCLLKRFLKRLLKRSSDLPMNQATNATTNATTNAWHYRCAITALSLHYRCPIAALSPHHCLSLPHPTVSR